MDVTIFQARHVPKDSSLAVSVPTLDTMLTWNHFLFDSLRHSRELLGKELAPASLVISLPLSLSSLGKSHLSSCHLYFVLQSLNKHRLSRKPLVFKKFLSYFCPVNINLPRGEGTGRLGYLL